jgi:hypothetical protein
MEMICIDKRTLKNFDQRQSFLIKRVIGLSKFARSTNLLRALDILKISEMYQKIKICFLKQVESNYLTKEIYLYLRSFYSQSHNNNSFIIQIATLKEELGSDEIRLKDTFNHNIQESRNREEVYKVRFLLKMLNEENNYSYYKAILNSILSYNRQ